MWLFESACAGYCPYNEMFYPVDFVLGAILANFYSRDMLCVFVMWVVLVFWYSDGVWDPEKWHASLYPTSERSSPVDGFKKDFVDERVPLKRRIPGISQLTEIFHSCV